MNFPAGNSSGVVSTNAAAMAVDLPLAKPAGPPAGQPFTWPEGVLPPVQNLEFFLGVQSPKMFEFQILECTSSEILSTSG